MTRFLLVATFFILNPIWDAEGQAKFDIGDRVQVGDPEGVNVRDAPAGALIGTQPVDMQGTVLDRPVVGGVNDITWYQINYDSGTDGWSGEDALFEVGGEPPPPPPPPPPTPGPLSAFPGAQGGGAESKGGRGGAVIFVTNLNDSGPGSLRNCMITQTGPRTCIFRTGGTILLQSMLRVTSPFLTVAGQSAPGKGIALSGKEHAQNLLVIATNNVILRYFRARKGFNSACSDECGMGVGVAGLANGFRNIIDHVTVSWHQDEGVSANRETHDLTYQYNIITEPVGGTPTPGGPNNAHPTGSTFAGAVGGANDAMVNIDFHHNLQTNTQHRNPLMRNQSSRVVNNIFYNQGWWINFVSGMDADVIGNLYKKGPNFGRTAVVHEVQIANKEAPGPPSLFMQGNRGYNQPNANGDQFVMAREAVGENQAETGAVRAAWRRSSPLANTTRPITAEPVGNLESTLLPHVGASRRLDCDGNWVDMRDSQDEKIINQVRTSTGPSNTIQGPETGYGGGGYPVLEAGTPCTDSDLDGMPNAWESARGLSNSNAADRNGDLDNDGYTNLEEYLNGPQGGTGPQPPGPISGTGVITEASARRSATGKVEVRGLSPRRPFGTGQ